MLKRSFLNPFSVTLLAFAAIAGVVDLASPPGSNQTLSPALLLIAWATGGIVRLACEMSSNRAYERHMASTCPRTVWREENGIWTASRAEDIRKGDRIRLSEGEPCPVEARIVSERGLIVSESSISGESGSYPRARGQMVLAGSVAVKGSAVLAAVSDFRPIGRDRPAASPSSGFAAGSRSICRVLLRFMAILIPSILVIRGIILKDWMQALLFSLSVAVGLVPEMLPVVTSACLSGSAKRLRALKTVVRDVDSMEALGDIDIICMDKTGTLTEDAARLEYFTDIMGNESVETLALAGIQCRALGDAGDQIDRAIVEAIAGLGGTSAVPVLPDGATVTEALPFERAARCAGVKVVVSGSDLANLGIATGPGESTTLAIAKGEVEEICSRCTHASYRGRLIPIDARGRSQALEIADEMRGDGIKVIAVSYSIDEGSWDNMALCGFLAFFDAPKPSAAPAIASLSNLGIQTRVLTGDSALVTRSVCVRLGIPASSILTGAELKDMHEDERILAIERTSAFAELLPSQKAEVVEILRSNGHTVGYLGDGMNDLLALKAADLGMVVESAAAEAKDTADIILTERNLEVVAKSVLEGRRAFANASKYIRIASSSNFGNICSVALASTFLPFLPAAAAQLLILNIAYDAMCLAMPWDNVDAPEVERPRTWSGEGLAGYMATFGPVSTIFDLLTFALLFLFVCPSACGGPFWHLDAAGRAAFISMFQAGWLLECAWTQAIVILVLRTRGIGNSGSRPSPIIAIAAGSIATISSLVLTQPLSSCIGIVGPPAWYVSVVAALSIAYAGCVLTVRRIYLARTGKLF